MKITVISAERLHELQVAEQEAKKFQAINDDLIKRLLRVTRNQVQNNQHAVEMRDKTIEEQAKYTAELRQYVSSLENKVRDLKVSVRHHKERHTHYMNKCEELQSRNKPSFDMKRDNAILSKRVSELYDAIEEIQRTVEDVL